MRVNTNTDMSVTANYQKSEGLGKAMKKEANVDTKTFESSNNVEPKYQETDTKKIKETVEKINKELDNSDTQIQFKVHESKMGSQNKVSIKVVEKDSEKVIIEIPSEEAIEFAEKMDEITGILFDHKG